jgi:hypothetical protein
MDKINKEWIIKEVHKLDPELKKTDEAFKIATIMLSALQEGANSKKIAKFLEIPEADIKKYEKNLRDNKIWIGNKTSSNWFEKSGGIAFWMDVAVAHGYMKRTK